MGRCLSASRRASANHSSPRKATCPSDRIGQAFVQHAGESRAYARKTTVFDNSIGEEGSDQTSVGIREGKAVPQPAEMSERLSPDRGAEAVPTQINHEAQAERAFPAQYGVEPASRRCLAQLDQ